MRSVASITPMKLRRMRSSSRLDTRSSRPSSAARVASTWRSREPARASSTGCNAALAAASSPASASNCALQALHAVLDRRPCPRCPCRIEARLEQFHQQAREQRIARQRLLRRSSARTARRPAAGTCCSARSIATWRHDRPAPRIRRLKPSFSASPRQNCAKASSKFSSTRSTSKLAAQRLRPRSPGCRRCRSPISIAIGMLGDDAQAHVLHHRQDVGQRDVVAQAIELEAQAAVVAPVEARSAGRPRRSTQRATPTSSAAIAGDTCST